MRRLNWGCGPCAAPDWINSDLVPYEGVGLCCDIREGLPLDAGSIDYIVSIHALQDLPYQAVLPALRELKRVLRPGGILRLGLPNLDRAIRAYISGDTRYFYVPDGDAKSIGAKLVTQIIWYGSVRTPFTRDFIEELLLEAGYRDIRHCSFGRTESAYPDIAQFDNRERESLFIEARA